jgi:hypothetical protein
MTTDYKQILQQWETLCEELDEARRGMVEARGKMSASTPPEIMDEFMVAFDEWKLVRAKFDELRKRLYYAAP